MAYVATKLNTGLLKTVESPFYEGSSSKRSFSFYCFLQKNFWTSDLGERKLLEYAWQFWEGVKVLIP